MAITPEQSALLEELLLTCRSRIRCTPADRAALTDLLTDIGQDDLSRISRGRGLLYPLWIRGVEDHCRERNLIV